ncbi:hypothetical protein PspLS_09115 [Pyricularia sp. CBS 133598]|nr:hypothetical protein PspLS_09115 [Pyricularia sp. CBS 133598]
MKLNIALLFTFMVGMTTAMPTDNEEPSALQADSTMSAALMAQCGVTNGYCDQNGCNGINNPGTGLGTCQSGRYKDCPCRQVCGSRAGQCSENGCDGINDLNGGLGTCQSGKYRGCRCQSVCGREVNSCGINGCEGKEYGTNKGETRDRAQSHMGWGAHLVVLVLTGATLLFAHLVHATTTRIYRHRYILSLDVVAGDGIDLGVVFPAQMIHTDPGNYSDPETYDAFRFSRPFEPDAMVQQDGEEEEKKRELMTTTTTATFLPFGYGRRSCLGRWLVAHMVKQALAHVEARLRFISPSRAKISCYDCLTQYSLS